MLSSLSVYIAPLLVFGLVVFVHELGHFLAAKWAGVYAPVFSLGWGRRLFGWYRGETDYRVSLIPLGGYVRMASRDDEAMAGIEGSAGDRGALTGSASPADVPARPDGVPAALWHPDRLAPFGPKPVPASRWVEGKSTGARVFILSAGVLMNILLTLVVSTGLSYRFGEAHVPAVIDSVVTGGPAAQAGLRGGDRIVAIDGVPVDRWDQVLDRVTPKTSGTITFDVRRASGEQAQVVVQPQVAEAPDPVTGAMRRVGRVGMAVRDSVVRTPVGLGQAMVAGGEATWLMARNVIQVLGGLVTGQVSAKNLGGPIQIAQTSVQAARNGAETLWALIAFLSLNIAILNLVPIPVLDGGQILLVLGERVLGERMGGQTREWMARIGVAVVLALILLVTVNDLIRLGE
jgi:regulator of sigma E protease